MQEHHMAVLSYRYLTQNKENLLTPEFCQFQAEKFPVYLAATEKGQALTTQDGY